ncbi:ribonuclease HI [Duganella sp. 3397]|uniref:ribonuclease HI family protein n=1 Tax=Duganella sp. 3397 TaxID=2817732 RepID=UPI00285C0088|nr:ribonuclease HI family protein [Duganella sp. 3397]MDR7049400.1 ribonuclease HI [Duganella sp. 3397]
MQPTEPLFDTLATAAFHGERVAARRLATRSQRSEAQALLEVLTQAAATAGLADLSALLAARGVAKQIDADRRAGRRAEQAARLAHRKAQLAPPSDRWRGWFDGSAHPNPGRIGIGALLCGPAGQRIEISRRAGHGNSGQAEYLALTALLEAAVEAGARDLLLYGDSQVVINDVNAGSVTVGASGLEDYRARVLALMAQTATSRLHWVPRHRNGDADRLSQRAIEPSPVEKED